jgi:RNA-directed DNA polymerase
LINANHPLFRLENLYQAYRQCRRRKRNTCNALAFEINLEANLCNLQQALHDGTYTPLPSIAFLVKKPKQREIFAADFRDRVVHHLLVQHLEPQWEPRFIYDSYACRRGKGTHRAVQRLRTFTRQITANQTRRAWYLQLDIRGFFISLNRRILFEQLLRREPNPTVRWLIKVILFNDPTENCRLRPAYRRDFERLPSHKTLFKAAVDCGLPIGNLTSQFFANVYLDKLDQFIKHQLKVPYYLRYCDDMVLLSVAQEELTSWEQQIQEFISHHLQLQLNERRKLRLVADGIDFLGYIVRPNYLLVRRRVIGNLWKRLSPVERHYRSKGGLTAKEYFIIYQWFNSYRSHFSKTSTHRLLAAIQRRWDFVRF